MTQEEKELLLRDLSAKLPYGIIINVNGNNERIDEINPFGEIITCGFQSFDVDECKPYLRPMSTMTENEKFEQKSKMHYEGYFVNPIYFHTIEEFDYLNSIHVDYRGLIEKGLAIEAPEGMYD